MKYTIPNLPLEYNFDTPTILKQVNKASRRLAELKGVALTIPNEAILINTLSLQEAKQSSEIENIITTQDELYKATLTPKDSLLRGPEKEVLNYREAIRFGFEEVKKDHILSNNKIKAIQRILVENNAGFQSQMGTQLKNQHQEVIYTPPQSIMEIEVYMAELERFINTPSMSDLDPLIKMAIIHHQFESIHPFYDGNGRTGRIINILYLIINKLLDLPILYLSRYITQHKSRYYHLIQAIRDKEGSNFSEWEEWILFILKGVEQTAEETILLIKEISELMARFKAKLRPLFGKQYKHELLNNLFFHPYTKIDFMAKELNVGRKTAAKYLDKIIAAGLLEKMKIGKENYYINTELVRLFTQQENGTLSSINTEFIF